MAIVSAMWAHAMFAEEGAIIMWQSSAPREASRVQYFITQKDEARDSDAAQSISPQDD